MNTVHYAEYDKSTNDTQRDNSDDPFVFSPDMENWGLMQIPLAMVAFMEWSIVHWTSPGVLIAGILWCRRSLLTLS